MKIIVVDDHIAAQETVTVALASDPATKHHVVTGVRTPDELHRIEDLETFGLAFVDLDFRRQSRKTGLFALRPRQELIQLPMKTERGSRHGVEYRIASILPLWRV